jgi:uncharacterized protein
MKELARATVLFVIFWYCLGVAALFAMQRPMLYAGQNYKTPATLGIDASEVIIATPDGEYLTGWYREAAAGQPTVLFMHGKGGTVSDRRHRWNAYADNGYGVLFFDYRGFGTSSGAPTESGLKTDALAAYEWLLTKIKNPKQIVLTAESLGTGPAVMVAAEKEVAGVSLMSPYSSIADVAAARYWWVPVRLLLRDKFEILPYAQRLKAPVLIQHGELDRTIPLHLGEKLFAAITSQKSLVVRQGLGHNNFGPSEYQIERKFIDEVTP